ncbi:MAG TPA: sensor histidine kinase [Williamwhitmania sp.]|nr:sensor histidine kinase [Williamwhitmania sp.]
MNLIHITKKSAIQIALHLLVWAFWFAAPFLFQGNENQHEFTAHLYRMWIPMLFSVVLFYLNYFLLVGHYLFHQKVWTFVLINLVAAILFVLVAEEIRRLLPPFSFPANTNYPHPPQVWLSSRLFFSYLFVISISVTIRVTGRWFLLETEHKNLENANLRSELSNLKMQLNPHFLFNTLNNIYSLIGYSPEKAQESVHRLAKLMRYHLYETNTELVSLSGEVEFLKSYIALMQLRTTDNVSVESQFNVENQSTQIAPLLFISLVENAFKHGVNPVSPSFIRVEMVEHSQIVSFETWNTNFPSKELNDQNAGIGMENLRKRLLLIYPGRHNFQQTLEKDVFHVKVVIQL